MSGSGIAPALLVAMPQLLDPNFKRAVVLVVHHDDEGTFGVVLNRDSGLTAAHLCESLDIRWSGDAAAGVKRRGALSSRPPCRFATGPALRPFWAWPQ